MSVWRLVVNDATNASIATYGPGAAGGDGGIVGLPSFDLDPSGNCVSLTFDAVAKRNAIAPRSIITLERYDGSAWVAWWKGMVTTVGTTRSDQVQRYTALGLKQYFYERVLDTPRWPLQPDVSTDAANLPEFTELEALVPGVTRDSTSTPTLGFSIGVNLPYRQFYGEFLDQRANQVGAFVVPTGETYTYDGVTYNAGDTVPATVWGVNADGLFFFRRTTASSVAVTEADPEVKVTWAPQSTEGKATAIDFTLIADVDREALSNVKASQNYAGPGEFFGGSWTSAERTFIPLSTRRPTTSSSYPVIERRFQTNNPLDFMKRNTITFTANAIWQNLSNATDNDPLTYAQCGLPFAAMTASGGTVTNSGGYRTHEFGIGGGTFTVSALGTNPEVEYLIVAGGGGGARGAVSVNTGSAGGGGGGGVLYGLQTVSVASYTITVGSGGSGATVDGTDGSSGTNSSAFGFTAIGGGFGGKGSGGSGGSGGGSSTNSFAVNAAGGAGTSGQGNNGGNTSSASFPKASGGGGATAASASGNSTGTAGGSGLSIDIKGTTAIEYGRGGNGIVSTTVAGGTGAAAFTGGGGEGGVGTNGGTGGTGSVYIRYRVTDPLVGRELGDPFDFTNPANLVSSSLANGVGVYVLRVASPRPIAVAVERTITITGTIGVDPFTLIQDSQSIFEYPATDTGLEIRVRTIVIPALSPSGLDGTILSSGVNKLWIFGTPALRIYDCAFYNVDDDLVSRIAEGLIQDPNSEAAVVDVQGYSPVATEVVITAIDNPSPVTMPVERVEYALTSNDGIVTRYYAGQRFDPELQTEATVIDGAIRRLTGSVEIL